MGAMRRWSVAGALLLVAACQAAPNGDAGARAQPRAWEWSWDTITARVGAVRAGRSLKPASWPGGARVAVLFSFDVDNETVDLRFGQPSVGGLSQGQYGARQGLRRVVDLMDRNSIPASFFIPVVSLKLAPDMAGLIKRSGRHEFAVHGWIHEMNTSLPPETERELVARSKAELEQMTGYAPVGYRAPSWNFSAATLGILRDLGFLYDTSLMADDDPYEIVANGEATGLVELPVEWIMDEAPLVNPLGNAYANPRDLARVWMDEFDRAYDEGGMFILTTHPHIIGHRSRIVALEQLIEHIRSKEGVWFATHRAAAEYVRDVRGAGAEAEASAGEGAGAGTAGTAGGDSAGAH